LLELDPRKSLTLARESPGEADESNRCWQSGRYNRSVRHGLLMSFGR
jgi:hypothetical protein